jgi:hypothetical protein
MDRTVNCDGARDLIVVAIYGKLSEEEERRLAAHLDFCRACARAYEKAKAYASVLNQDAEIPLPDWERSWSVIRGRALGPKKGLSVLLAYRKIAVAGAALAVVFVFGFLLGRHLLEPAGDDPGYAPYANYRSVSAADYSERVDMLLVNFLNRSDGDVPAGFRDVEREIVADVLAETRLLRLLAERRGDRYRYRVLEEVEMVLVNMSNLGPEDESSAEQVDRFIRNRDIRLQLRNLTDLKSTI